MELDIAIVAKRSGVPASTLRYYEERGLIASIGRQGLRRVFDASVLELLALIALGRAAGFSLDEVAQMFAADGSPRIDRRQLKAKADQLDRTLRRLTAVRDGLRHAAVCPAPSHLECPTFRRLLAGAKVGSRSRPRGKTGSGSLFPTKGKNGVRFTYPDKEGPEGRSNKGIREN